jgi:hypothetical protein
MVVLCFVRKIGTTLRDTVLEVCINIEQIRSRNHIDAKIQQH